MCQTRNRQNCPNYCMNGSYIKAFYVLGNSEKIASIGCFLNGIKGQGQCLIRLHFKITVRVVFPEIVPEVAVMVVVPAATAVTRPLLLTVATCVFDEVQVTDML